MRLSASLLALAAAVSPLASAAPMQSAGGPTFLPDAHSDVTRVAIRSHIDLAELALTHIARNFENPPLDDPDSDSDDVLCVNGDGRLKELHAPDHSALDLDVDGLIDFGGLSLDDGPSGGGEPECRCVLDPKNFETDALDRQVHVLSEGAARRRNVLAAFHGVVGVFVFPNVQGHEWPAAAPDAELSDADLRGWLLGASSSLFDALRAKYEADVGIGGRFPWSYWKSRIEYLDLAIGAVQIYVNEPLGAHGAALRRLFDAVFDFGGVDGGEILQMVTERLKQAEDAGFELYGTTAGEAGGCVEDEDLFDDKENEWF